MGIKELRERMAALVESANAIRAKAAAEKRDLSEEELTQLEGHAADYDRTQRQVVALERLEAQEAEVNASAGRVATPAMSSQQSTQGTAQTAQASTSSQPAASTSSAAGQRAGGSPSASQRQRQDDGLRNTRLDAAERSRWGWSHVGDFAMAVRSASQPGGHVDQRLVNAPTTYGSEGVGADGGFAVPPEFRDAIMTRVMGEESLLARCDQTETGGSGMTVPQDNATPWQSTGGIQAYWEGEGAQFSQSKPALGSVTNKLNKLTALVPVTDELLEDAPSLASWINRKAPEKIDFKVSDAIINGNGVGMPLGIMNGGSTISVAAEGSQAAATILAANVMKMYSRMYAPYRFNSVWLINQDCEPQLMQMTVNVKNVAGTENVGGGPVYIPPGGLSATPYGILLGRPVIPVQPCQTLGTVGDIIFASMNQYWAVLKAGGIRADSSIHLFFDYGQTAFRFTFRMGGQPWHASTISPKNGSNTLGAFVTLATRAG